MKQAFSLPSQPPETSGNRSTQTPGPGPVSTDFRCPNRRTFRYTRVSGCQDKELKNDNTDLKNSRRYQWTWTITPGRKTHPDGNEICGVFLQSLAVFSPSQSHNTSESPPKTSDVRTETGAFRTGISHDQPQKISPHKGYISPHRGHNSTTKIQKNTHPPPGE